MVLTEALALQKKVKYRTSNNYVNTENNLNGDVNKMFENKALNEFHLQWHFSLYTPLKKYLEKIKKNWKSSKYFF